MPASTLLANTPHSLGLVELVAEKPLRLSAANTAALVSGLDVPPRQGTSAGDAAPGKWSAPVLHADRRPMPRPSPRRASSRLERIEDRMFAYIDGSEKNVSQSVLTGRCRACVTVFAIGLERGADSSPGAGAPSGSSWRTIAVVPSLPSA